MGCGINRLNAENKEIINIEKKSEIIKGKGRFKTAQKKQEISKKREQINETSLQPKINNKSSN